MKNNYIFIVLIFAVCLLGITVLSQMENARKNSVWSVSLIKIPSGMEKNYLSFLTNDWKKQQETLKKEGQILSYKVLSSENSDSADLNLILMSEYINAATMEANADTSEIITAKLSSNIESARQIHQNRFKMHEILGDQIKKKTDAVPRQ